LLQYLGYGGITSKQREAQLKNHDAVALRTIREQLPELAITFDQVSELRALFVGGGTSMSELDERRVALADLYLNLLVAFASRHHGEPGLEPLKRHEGLKVAHTVLRAPLLPGWTSVVKRLLSLDPGLLWCLLRRLPVACCRRLRLLLTAGDFGKRRVL
jgi:hypothetical protein